MILTHDDPKPNSQERLLFFELHFTDGQMETHRDELTSWSYTARNVRSHADWTMSLHFQPPPGSLLPKDACYGENIQVVHALGNHISTFVIYLFLKMPETTQKASSPGMALRLMD